MGRYQEQIPKPTNALQLFDEDVHRIRCCSIGHSRAEDRSIRRTHWCFLFLHFGIDNSRFHRNDHVLGCRIWTIQLDCVEKLVCSDFRRIGTHFWNKEGHRRYY